MSAETLDWLNDNTLIGFTDKRGNAWHYREGADNHYAGAVPLEDVHRRLFSWTAEERPLYIETPLGEGDSVMMPIEGRKAIVRSDNGHIMGIFKEGYQPHQYGEWLLNNVANILDAELSIGSAGLLAQGGKAWVSVEMPETLQTGEFAYRPNLLATTSFDGSIATTYKPVVTAVVCDNTLSMAMSELSSTFKVKHSKGSMSKITDAREALGIVHTMSETFAQAIEELTHTKISDHVWEGIVNELSPMPDQDADPRSLTLAEKKRDTLWEFWTQDERVSPWRGTALGAWQAFNTYAHHNGIVRNVSRPERNMMNAVNGTTAKLDKEVLEVIMSLAA
jgi:phage/plasmid-like protein (TIGR03299 family)